MNINNKSNNSTHTSKIIDTAIDWTSTTLSASKDKVSDLSKRYLNIEYLTTKAIDATKAKILPLSNPPGWDQKVQETKASIGRIKILQVELQKRIKDRELELNTAAAQDVRYRSPEAKAKRIESINRVLTELREESEKIGQALAAKYELIDFYENQRAAQISARFAGYAGMAADTVVPGSGTITSLALTSLTTMNQVDSVSLLSEDNPKAQEERKNVRLGVVSTLACTIISLGFTYWALPALKNHFYNA